MLAAVTAAEAARQAKALASDSAEEAQNAIRQSGICTARRQNFSQAGSRCAALRPRPVQSEFGQSSSSTQGDWGEFGFFPSRFDADTISTRNVQIISHLHLDHLVHAAFCRHLHIMLTL